MNHSIIYSFILLALEHLRLIVFLRFYLLSISNPFIIILRIQVHIRPKIARLLTCDSYRRFDV